MSDVLKEVKEMLEELKEATQKVYLINFKKKVLTKYLPNESLKKKNQQIMKL